MLGNYKIFKCEICDINNPCYCIMTEATKEILPSDLHNCIIHNIGGVKWQEINKHDLINIKQILENK